MIKYAPRRSASGCVSRARDGGDLTQADAAAAIGVARTTIVAIEQGQRRVRMGELQKLAQLYGTSVNALLRREAVHVDLAPRFRKLFDSKTAPSARRRRCSRQSRESRGRA